MNMIENDENRNGSKRNQDVIVELSPVAYLALCGLVRDALQHPSDASPLLDRVAKELANATAGGVIPDELAEEPARVEALRRGGFIGH
jgi:hypothetical protein